MTNVIGLEVEDRLAHWVTMRNLREDIKNMRSLGNDKYNIAINKETDIVKTLIKEFVSN